MVEIIRDYNFWMDWGDGVCDDRDNDDDFLLLLLFLSWYLFLLLLDIVEIP